MFQSTRRCFEIPDSYAYICTVFLSPAVFLRPVRLRPLGVFIFRAPLLELDSRTCVKRLEQKAQNKPGHRREESVCKSGGFWFKSAHVWTQTPRLCVCVCFWIL